MHKYKLVWSANNKRAKTKAWVTHARNSPRGEILEFEARSHEDAMAYIQAAILPGDDRPIRGRSNLRFCTVHI